MSVIEVSMMQIVLFGLAQYMLGFLIGAWVFGSFE